MYIVEHTQQVQLIKEMTQLRRDMENFVVYYHHPHTNQMWKSFFPVASNGDLGPKLLRHEPLPELDELLDICLSEDVPENAVGLGIELSVAIEKWMAIFDILEKNYSNYQSGQLKLFLNNLELDKYQEKIKSGIGNDEATYIEMENEIKKLTWRSKKLKLKKIFK